MILIVDSNIVISSLIRDSTTRSILINTPFILYAPETMINEIRKYEDYILKKSGLTKSDFERLFDLVSENINILEKEKYEKHLEEADKIIGHVHKGDVPFVALALAITNDGIWTDDKDFERQNRIKIWKTKDILNLINISKED